MIRQQTGIILSFLMVLDALSIALSGYGAYFVYIAVFHETWDSPSQTLTLVILFVVFVNNYIMGRIGLYRERRSASLFVIASSISKAIFIDVVLLAAGMLLVYQEGFPRLFLVFFGVFAFTVIFCLRIFSRFFLLRYLQAKGERHNIAIIGNKKRVDIVTDILKTQLSFGMKTLGRISIYEDDNDDVIGNISNFAEILRNNALDEIVFAIDSDAKINILPYIDICRKMGVSFRILPALWGAGDFEMAVEMCQDMPFLTFQMNNFNVTGLLYKRILDLIGGVAGTLIFLAMYPIVGLAIKIDSKGPVLFKQKRKGLKGRVFELYKFRSMYVDAEEQKEELTQKNIMDGAMFKMEDDPRITRVGKFIRKTSIDEFPQFLNVLRGEMSIVGTRPPTLDEVVEYKLEHMKRISIKPGITGLWQISGRNSIRDFNEVVALDLAYINNWRFVDDLKIILKTILVVLQKKGVI